MVQNTKAWPSHGEAWAGCKDFRSAESFISGVDLEDRELGKGSIVEGDARLLVF